MENRYRVSVVVPVYNQEPYLEKSVSSLLSQTMPPQDLQILLIDDGSTDASPAMCDAYAAANSNVRVVHKENGGLSDARNCGIDNAEGKYIMYLDGDDSLQEDTCLAVADFFDEHYDEVDLVTYPSVTIKAGKKSRPHYRYTIFKGSGIFDLEDDENVYAAVTRIEVCVKNLGPGNVRFSDNRDFRHEDQKYCIDVLLPKLKVGYCDKGAYYYEQQADGLQNTTFYSYYLFESTMDFWEEEFGKFEGPVPRYLQALYVSDVNWKNNANVLLPYHYDEPELREAISRIERLLSRVDVGVIASHPSLDSFKKAFLLQHKPGCQVKVESGINSLSLVANGTTVYTRNKVEIILLKTVARDNRLELFGFLKSPCFQFGEKPVLFANEFGAHGHRFVPVPLRESSWCYNGSKVKTNRFWLFSYELVVEDSGSVDFKVDFNGHRLSTNYYFMPRAVFSSSAPKRYRFERDGWLYRFDSNTFRVSSLDFQKKPENVRKPTLKSEVKRLMDKRERVRSAAMALKASGRRIWLYHDCHGVEKNNAYYQYMHDIQKDDGVERFYVVNDLVSSKRHLFSPMQMRRVIRFKGPLHKILFLGAEKVITAYVEQNNWMAFGPKAMKHYTDIFDAEVVYLQHGVLHSHQPWKYSLDRLLIDKEVVSTGFEVRNLCSNYCFDKENLIEAGMPRYDYIDCNVSPDRKILLAPSWRKFLVRQKSDGQWYGVPDVFAKSKFYLEMKEFLESPELSEMLEKHDYVIDVKLHPILSELYADMFDFPNPRIRRAGESVDDSSYAVFITDFSSYRFDFVYLKRAILYFFPDEDLFRSGMCDYRETDLPLEGMFGDMARSASEAVEMLAGILGNGGRPKKRFLEQMEGFFLHYDNDQRARIYDDLAGKR